MLFLKMSPLARKIKNVVITSLGSVNGASMHHSSGGFLAGEVLHGSNVNGPEDGIHCTASIAIQNGYRLRACRYDGLF